MIFQDWRIKYPPCLFNLESNMLPRMRNGEKNFMINKKNLDKREQPTKIKFKLN